MAIKPVTKISPEDMNKISTKLDRVEDKARNMHTGNVAHQKANIIQILWSIRKDLGIQKEN